MNKLICWFKGHKHKFHHKSEWYDFTKKPWKPIFHNVGRCVRCGDMRKI